MATIVAQQTFDSVQAPALTAGAAGARSPQEVLLQTGLAYIASACLNTAVKLRIPDLIGGESKSIDVLALESGTDQDYLYRILRVLETSQIVTRTSARSYKLTETGQLLRRGVPGSMADCIEWIADPLHLTLYSELKRSVEEGTTTFDRVYGEPFFNWLSKPENKGEAAVFNNAMTSVSEMCIPAFLEAYDFSGFKKIVDVGGGHGALLRSILHANPAANGVVAEMAAVVPSTKRAIAEDRLASRCEAVECNFFEAVPAGGDCYVMKHIVHDWADGAALQLLRNIRSVISADGKLILAEAVLDDSSDPHPGKLLDIEMMAFVGGKERTRNEFERLLRDAGFALERIVATKSPLCLLEARPM
jgi:O-methyltransferase domain